jgi:hypothetical protein
VEKATAEAEKHADRSEQLAALVAEAREMLEQARVVKAERARVAAEEAEAAAAVKAAAEAATAAQRLHMEEQMSALTLRMQSDALQLQQMRAQMGSSVAPPVASHPEETQCVVCMDAPKDHILVPCGHQCVCEACAEKLMKARSALCPFCRTPISTTVKVFVV